MSGHAVGIQRLVQTLCWVQRESGGRAGRRLPPLSWPRGARDWPSWVRPAVLLHPWRWGRLAFALPIALVSPRLGHWLCCFMATRPVSCIRACLGWALPSWGLWLLSCPCQRVLASLRGPGDVWIFAITLNEQALLPPELPPCSPCWLWRGPFPAGGTCQLRVHDSKWRH